MADYAAERYDDDQKPIPFYTFDHVGASAVYSSAHDLVRFGMFHLKVRLPDHRSVVGHGDSMVPVRLLVKPDGDTHVWLGNQPRAILNDVSLIDGRLSGRFAGQIPTEDAKRWPHFVMLGLLLQDGTLRGQANAMSVTDPIMYSLASYVELKRQP